MTYYDPSNPLGSVFANAFRNLAGKNPNVQIDPEQFRRYAVTLDERSIQHFVQIARNTGVSEEDIQAGVNFIKSLQ